MKAKQVNLELGMQKHRPEERQTVSAERINKGVTYWERTGG